MWFYVYCYPDSNWEEIRAEALARGAKYYYWASEYGYNAMYNGDTLVFYTDINALPAAMQVDAKKHGKTL